MKSKLEFLVIVSVLLLSGAAFPQQDQTSPKSAVEKGSPEEFQPPKAIHKQGPIFPAEARAKRIRGVVVLRVLVDKEGNVANATMVSGPPPFRDAALAAVKEWKFKPATLRGQPIEAPYHVTFNFDDELRR